MRPLAELKVADVMTPDPRTVGRNDSLDHADAVMTAGGFRHLPVLDEDGLLTGVVSGRDMFKGALARALGYGSTAQQKVLSTLLVKEVMSGSPVTTTPAVPLVTAAKLMRERRIGCLPVVDGQRLVGMLSESDVLAVVAGQALR